MKVMYMYSSTMYSKSKIIHGVRSDSDSLGFHRLLSCLVSFPLI
jgi:hypothetical protein